MIDVLGVIPARGGSKRLPRKNLLEVDGTPLVCRAIHQAMASGVIDKIVVSTDDGQIASVVNDFCFGCVHMREPRLARDDTPMLPVVVDAFNHYPAKHIILLQPTSPFRTPEDIVKAYELLKVTNGDSVFSVTEAPDDLVFELGWAGRLRKVPDIVLPNGALFLITGQALERGESWFSGIAYAYKMPKDRSLDIDTEQDLIAARAIANAKSNGDSTSD